MFGDILGNLEEKQKELKEKLREVPIKIQMENGSLLIEGNAAKEIGNITIDPQLIIEQGTEGLEDLLVVGINKFMEAAAGKESEMMKGFLSGILPSGLGGLGGLFSQ